MLLFNYLSYFAEFLSRRLQRHSYGKFLLCSTVVVIFQNIWWLVELPMWLTDGFRVTFLEGGGDIVHTC